MTKNPFINAGVAIIYIVGVILFIFTFVDGPVEARFPLLMPLTMVSLFTLSAAFMGYTFLYHPTLLILEKRHTEGTALFLKTLGIFAAYVAVLLVAVSIAARL